MTYRFIPPTGTHDFVVDRDAALTIEVSYGITLVQDDGDTCSFRQVIDPSQIELEAADAYYLGGHTYMVSDAVGQCLTSAGYGSYLIFVGPDDTPGLYSDIYFDTYTGAY